MTPTRTALRLLSVSLLSYAAVGSCLAQGDAELTMLKQIGSPNTIQLSQNANKLLEENPASVAARIVLSNVAEERDEVDEALRQANLAWTAARVLPPVSDEKSPSFQALALYRLAELLGNLDRRVEQLQWLGEYEKTRCFQWELQSGIRYPAARLKLLALLKLGRTAEAGRYLDEVEAHPSRRGLTPDQLAMDRIRVAGLSSRSSGNAGRLSLVLEDEMRTRGKRIDTGYLVNFAQWAVRRGDLDKALALYREAAGSVHPETRFNPHQGMAEIHISRGEWEKARSELSNAWRILKLKKPAVRLEMIRSLRLTVSRFYLCYGSPDKALEFLEGAYGEPQRMRDSLASATQSKAQAAYYRAVALRNFSKMFSGITGSSFQKLASVPLDSLRQWESEQKLAGLVSAEFAEPLAPQNAMSVVSAVFPSQWTELPRVLGGAFARRLFDDLGMDDSLQAYTPFFRVLIGGRGRSSRSEAAAALDALPGWDVLARARMEVVLAELSESNSEAFAHYASAWRLHAPSLVGARIPVRIQDSGGGREVLDLVSWSSSISVVDTEPAFVLEVGNGRAVFSVLGRSGVVEVPLINRVTSANAAAVVRAIFAAGPPLTEHEMSVLDGRTLSSSTGAAETGR
jgi:hypothetical protein